MFMVDSWGVLFGIIDTQAEILTMDRSMEGGYGFGPSSSCMLLAASRPLGREMQLLTCIVKASKE